MNVQDPYQRLRENMVREQLKANGIHQRRVLEAMRAIPRHEFVPWQQQPHAYEDRPLPIGVEQTISQPYMVAFMTQALGLAGRERVLEVGTGSGYQTAVLCALASHVYTLEYYPQLADRAAQTLARLNINNVDVHIGDGSQGLADMAPFDAIIVTAAAPALPGPLRSQLSNGGRLILPIGDRQDQYLERIVRHGSRWEIEQLLRVRFVPLLGRYGFQLTANSHDDNAHPAGV